MVRSRAEASCLTQGTTARYRQSLSYLRNSSTTGSSVKGLKPTPDESVSQLLGSGRVLVRRTISGSTSASSASFAVMNVPCRSSAFAVAERVGGSLVGDDHGTVRNSDGYGVGVVDVVLRPSSRVVSVHGELEVDSDAHARQAIEEVADELPPPLRVVVAETSGEPPDRESVLFEDLRRGVPGSRGRLHGPESKLAIRWIFRRSVDEEADELLLPFQTASTNFCGALSGSNPYRSRSTASYSSPCGPASTWYSKPWVALIRISRGNCSTSMIRTVGIMDLKGLFDALEGPVDTYSERIEVLWAEGGATELLVHRNQELIAEQISPRADRSKV